MGFGSWTDHPSLSVLDSQDSLGEADRSNQQFPTVILSALLTARPTWHSQALLTEHERAMVGWLSPHSGHSVPVQTKLLHLIT